MLYLFALQGEQGIDKLLLVDLDLAGFIENMHHIGEIILKMFAVLHPETNLFGVEPEPK